MSTKKRELDAQLEVVARKIGKTLEEVREEYLEVRIREMFTEFLHFRDLVDNPLNASNLKNNLRRVGNACRGLQRVLADLEPREAAWLGKVDSAGTGGNGPFDWLAAGDDVLEAEDLISHLEKFSRRADRAVEFLSHSRGGRPEDLPLKYFIRRMAFLWEEATGKKPARYGTRFSKWVENCLNNLGYPPHSIDALNKTIQRTLS